jgi:hypothetical protein
MSSSSITDFITSFFSENGFDNLSAEWNNPENMKAFKEAWFLDYKERMESNIEKIFESSDKETITYDILDNEKMTSCKLVERKVKQYRMNVGKMWQSAIGNYDGFVDLGNSHKSKLDILSVERKLWIEIKNRTNTVNSTSNKGHFDILAKCKKDYLEYTCIIAHINDDTKEKTTRGSTDKINHSVDNVKYEIERHVGMPFLRFIFRENTEEVIEYLKIMIEKYQNKVIEYSKIMIEKYQNKVFDDKPLTWSPVESEVKLVSDLIKPLTWSPVESEVKLVGVV